MTGEFDSKVLTKTGWAFAAAGCKEERLFTAWAAAAEQRMRDFGSQGLAETAWTFVTWGSECEGLFMALVAAAPRLVRDLNSQGSRVAH